MPTITRRPVTLRRTATAAVLVGGLVLGAACTDEDGDGAVADEEIDQIENELDEVGDDLEEGVQDGVDAIDQGADEAEDDIQNEVEEDTSELDDE